MRQRRDAKQYRPSGRHKEKNRDGDLEFTRDDVRGGVVRVDLTKGCAREVGACVRVCVCVCVCACHQVSAGIFRGSSVECGVQSWTHGKAQKKRLIWRERRGVACWRAHGACFVC